ncbi:HAD family hydrolase [Nevskia soli]|uniref:HAD family hydrolase n=1 Tax=Nevskia soli TaxID=418856 RepID=UPI001470191B|nr:HAD family hydrolase [Nevskia soli]
MNGSPILSLHDAHPDIAIDALSRHVGPVLLDLDETLYLGNSTEDFIDCAHPGVAALLLLRLLDMIKPWRWTGGESTRDSWRVRLVSTFFPWTHRRWRKRVTSLAARFTNQRLLNAVKSRGSSPIIATVGFDGIVTPLVAAMGLPEAVIVAARVNHWQDRRGGKLDLVVGALGEDVVKASLVITDSVQDLPLLNACARPLRTTWPQARFRHALSAIYLPGQYVSRVKRPGERYIFRGILQEDFAYWVLSSIALAAIPGLHLLGLLFLLISFWAVYERGYVDNDLVAERYESHPKLTSAFFDAPVATPAVQPWIWALACGYLGILLLRWPGAATPQDLATWMAALGLSHLSFLLYNRLDKTTRVWMYVGLQFARTTVFAALVPISPVGALALAAHVMARWLPYIIYRLGQRSWPDAPLCLIRLFFLTLLMSMLALTEGLSLLMNWTTLALFGWTLLRARTELWAVLKAAHFLSKPKVEPRQ